MGYLDQFNYQISGSKTARKLVFLHGVLGSLANWRRITPAFESEYEILTFDQRGHGRSMKPERGYGPEDFADDLLKILDELGWEKIYLVGHSMGGRNALNFGYRYPQRIAKLVLEDIGPDSDPKAMKKLQDLVNSVPTPFSTKAQAKEFFQDKFGGGTLGSFLFTNIEEKPNGTFDWRFHKPGIMEAIRMGRATDRWHEVKGLKVPTLSIRGDRSEEFPKEIFEKLITSNPNIKGVEIKDSAHWVHFEQPDEFIAELKKFF